MKRAISIVAVVAAIIVAEPRHLHAQGIGAALAGQVIGDVLAQLDESLNALVDNTLNGVNDLQFSTLQQVRMSINALRNASTEVLDKTFDELDKAQREAFSNVFLTIEKLKSGESQVAKDARQLVNEVDVAISRLPFAKDMPLVKDMSPTVLSESAALTQKHFTVRATGSLLAQDEARLVIGDAECERIGMVETRLEFRCPSDAFPFAELGSFSLGSAILTIPKKSTIWEKWFGDEKAPLTYELPIVLVPDKMGEYALSYEVKRDNMIVQDRRVELDRHNGHCERNRNVSLRVTADPGWRIKTNSIAWHQRYKSTESSFEGFSDVTEGGFIANGKLRNHGQCVRVLGKVVAKDARGALGGTITYQQYKTEQVTEKVAADGGSIYWSRDLVFEMPKDTVRYTINVTTVRNEHRLFSGPDSHDWFEIVSPASGQVILKPKKIEAVLH